MTRLEVFVDAVSVDRIDITTFGQAHVRSVPGSTNIRCTLDGRSSFGIDWTYVGVPAPLPGTRLFLEVPDSEETP